MPSFKTYKTKVSVSRTAKTSEVNGTFVAGAPTTFSERCDVQPVSAKEREYGSILNAETTDIAYFRSKADIRRGDVITINGKAYTVQNSPDNSLRDRRGLRVELEYHQKSSDAK